MKGASFWGIAHHFDQEGVVEIAKRVTRPALAQGSEAFVANEILESTAQRAFERRMRCIPSGAQGYFHFDPDVGKRHGSAVVLYRPQQVPLQPT
jgi:hypothetical protein